VGRDKSLLIAVKQIKAAGQVGRETNQGRRSGIQPEPHAGYNYRQIDCG